MNKGGTQQVGDFRITMTHAMHSTRSKITERGFTAANQPDLSYAFLETSRYTMRATRRYSAT
jgi:hypothetical protein